MDDIHIIGRFHGELFKGLKPYMRDKEEELIKLLELGFVRCEFRFKFHYDFNSSKFVCCIQIGL